ncbi:hypothetical protein ABZ341_35890 [Streptomyces sp. NPDC006173]|uniref:hypothetical protein n=1 Tax=Streptomyces sp. NPDC006173 TaxID=3155349 RepID=UPI0033F67A2A
MNGIALTLRALHHGERRFARELTTMAERHRADHEVHHVACDLAGWSLDHVRRLVDAGRAYGEILGDAPESAWPGPPPSNSGTAAMTSEQPPAPSLLLLHDLRALHLYATEISLYWEMLAQVAHAVKVEELLTLASKCHPQTLRQMRWTNTLIKDMSPQILTSL